MALDVFIIELAIDTSVKYEISQNLFNLVLSLLIKDLQVLSLIVDSTCQNWCFCISWIWYIWFKDVCNDLHSTSTHVLVKLNLYSTSFYFDRSRRCLGALSITSKKYTTKNEPYKCDTLLFSLWWMNVLRY